MQTKEEAGELTRFNFHPPHVSRTQDATAPSPATLAGALATSSSAATIPKMVVVERILAVPLRGLGFLARLIAAF